jgi:uncharacterized protein YbjT (DUF2867 family)
MKILLTGATGFIGRHLRQALLGAGHSLLCTSREYRRDSARCQWVVVDFAQVSTARWCELLTGIDAVVNTVGVFRESGDATFAMVHGTAARRLFVACVHAGVSRVVHVSALGADADASSEYHVSKRAADEHLLSLPLDATVVQPSLVFGLDGTSSRAMLTWASLPLVPLPGGGVQRVQPVHVADVTDALTALLHARGLWQGQRVVLVGPVPLALRDYLRALRGGLGLPSWRAWAVPAAWVPIALRVAERWPGALFDRAAWHMLQRGNVGDVSAMASLLGRVPRCASRFIEPGVAQAVRQQAQLGWLLPLLRLSLAAVWIVTAVVSFGLYPAEQSYALLQRAGVPTAWQPLALYGAAVLDLVLGVLTLWPLRWTRPLWMAQMVLILAYTLIISWRLPEHWLHPYGPISKNLPMLAVLVMLFVLSPARSSPRT